MKALIEKQILEWQQEIIKQNTYVMRLEGGIQAYQLLLLVLVIPLLLFNYV